MKTQLDKRQNIRLDESMLKSVSGIAEKEDRTVSSTLRILVKEALSARGILPRRDKDKTVSIRPATIV